MTSLRKRCSRLIRERDEARAAQYSEASRSLALGTEIDGLLRAREQVGGCGGRGGGA